LKDHCSRCTADLTREPERCPRSNSSSSSASSPLDPDWPVTNPSSDGCGMGAQSPMSDHYRHTNEASQRIWSYLHRPRLSDDDICHLQKKGALDVPERGLTLELLTNYCNYIHPQLPFLDLRPILSSLLGQSGWKISLLLFQAIMFAGAASTDDRVFRLYGYPSRSQAQDMLFQRVKVRSRKPNKSESPDLC